MIYILHNDPKKTAEMLDDKSLETMIKDIAQVLCNVHLDDLNTYSKIKHKQIPLPYTFKTYIEDWMVWTRECKANYLYLAELGASCLAEHAFRTGGKRNYKYAEALLWARDNVPKLPDRSTYEAIINKIGYTDRIQQRPMILPKKYQIKGFGFEGCPNGREIQSYRNYYEAKLKGKLELVGYDKGKISVYLLGTLEPNLTTVKKELRWTNRSKPDWLNI